MTRNADSLGAYAVVLQGVVKTYRMGEGVVRALGGVDLEVPVGEVLAVMGPSGSGKTTLLNLVGALDVPSEGVVKVAGADLARLAERELTRFRRHHVGFIFQSFNLISVLTSQENVELPMLFTKTPRVQRQARSRQLLETVGLSDRGDHTPDRLSGGEQQRVAIARALANNPELILADEPTGELDEATGSRIAGLLIDLVHAQEKTMIVVTHNPQIASRADRVLHLRSGQFAYQSMSGDESRG